MCCHADRRKLLMRSIYRDRFGWHPNSIPGDGTVHGHVLFTSWPNTYQSRGAPVDEDIIGEYQKILMSVLNWRVLNFLSYICILAILST